MCAFLLLALHDRCVGAVGVRRRLAAQSLEYRLSHTRNVRLQRRLLAALKADRLRKVRRGDVALVGVDELELGDLEVVARLQFDRPATLRAPHHDTLLAADRHRVQTSNRRARRIELCLDRRRKRRRLLEARQLHVAELLLRPALEKTGAFAARLQLEQLLVAQLEAAIDVADREVDVASLLGAQRSLGVHIEHLGNNVDQQRSITVFQKQPRFPGHVVSL